MMDLVLAHFQHNILTKSARQYPLCLRIEVHYTIPIFSESLTSVLISQLWQIVLSPLHNPGLQWRSSPR